MRRLYEVYNDYINYLTRTGEEITFNEWRLQLALQEGKGKMREFEPAVQKYLKYGIAALLGGAIFTPLTIGLYSIYRRNSDYCVRKCGGHGFLKAKGTVTQLCYNKCYAQAAKMVIDKIKKDLTSLGRIEDAEQRKKIEKKLRKELDDWEEKYDTYKLRAETAPQAIVGARSAGVYKKRGKK